jgi:hypothetical protein
MRTALISILVVACGDPSGTSHAYTLAITQTAIRNLVGSGAPGMNFDGRVSDATDASGCHQEDLVDPFDGEVGVDNALGGSLDLTLISERPQPFDPPDSVALGIRGPAALEEAERVEITLGGVELATAEVVDGRFQAIGPADAALTLELGFTLESSTIPLTLIQPAIQGRITEEGEVIGERTAEAGELVELVIGGRLDIDAAVAAATEADPELDPTLIRTTLEGLADLDPDEDGDCQSVSIAFLAEVTD